MDGSKEMLTTLRNWPRATSIITLYFLCSACISVRISPENQTARANSVQYSAPPAPFVAMENTPSDAAWENPISGSSISYLSDCSETADTPLKQQFQNMINAIQNVTIKTEEQLKYNGRAALRHTFTGTVDGIQMKICTIHLRKNSCSYVLTYVASQETFEKDLMTFNLFIKDFKAP
jgi:hypothetical protein